MLLGQSWLARTPRWGVRLVWNSHQAPPREMCIRDRYRVGDEQTVAAFAETKKVDVTGTSKGKGFAGVMKRYGFRGGPGGHGAHFHRCLLYTSRCV